MRWASFYFRVGDLLKSPVGKTLLQEMLLDREASKGLKKLEQTLGLEVASIESVTLMMMTPGVGGFAPWDMPKLRYKGLNQDLMPVPAPRLEDKKAIEKQESPVLYQEYRRVEGGIIAMDVPPQLSVGMPLVIVTSTKPLDRKKMMRSLLSQTPSRDGFDRSHFQGGIVLVPQRSLGVDGDRLGSESVQRSDGRASRRRKPGRWNRHWLLGAARI